MSRRRVAREVVIDAPSEAVFAAVTDWAAQGRWVPGTRVWADGPAHRVGGRIVAFTGLGRLGFADPMEITAWDPPNTVAIRHTGRFVHGTGALEVRALPDGRSTFQWREEVELPFGVLGAAAFVLVQPALEAMLGRALSTLAGLVESGELGD